MSTFRFAKGGTRAGYYVQLRPGLKPLGRVWKNERHYNLRRPLVVRGWSATTDDGVTFKQNSCDATIYATREEAAQALLKGQMEDG